MFFIELARSFFNIRSNKIGFLIKNKFSQFTKYLCDMTLRYYDILFMQYSIEYIAFY